MPLPSLPSLWKPCLASCAESDLSKASQHTVTPPSTAESLVLGTFYTFSNVFAVKVTLLEWGRRWRALWSCGQGCSLQRCLETDGPCLVQRTDGLARWEVGTPSLGSSVDVPPVSCWGTRGRLRGGNGPHLQQISLPWSHYIPRSGGARLHLCAALNACMANAAWVQGLAASWVLYRGLRFSYLKIFLVLIIIESAFCGSSCIMLLCHFSGTKYMVGWFLLYSFLLWFFFSLSQKKGRTVTPYKTCIRKKET